MFSLKCLSTTCTLNAVIIPFVHTTRYLFDEMYRYITGEFKM